MINEFNELIINELNKWINELNKFDCFQFFESFSFNDHAAVCLCNCY